MESILTSIKNMLGIADEYTHFDADLITHINSVLSILTQSGVGPAEGFSIEDELSVWEDFVPENSKLELIKSYTYMKVKLLFDPTLISAVIESTKESILTSIKKMLGIADEYTHFDADLIMHINSVLAILTQIGVGPSEGFTISGESDKWEDFTTSNKLEHIKTYMYLKVKLMFDPPLSSAVMESYNRIISELEWRILISGEEENIE